MPEQLQIRDSLGQSLNARVDVVDGHLILHSRSGTERNRDYRAALETVLYRLDHSGMAYDIYLDSQPAQALPLSDRKLLFSRQPPIPERFNEIVRAMNAGSSSHGAWRRLRIEVPDAPNGKLVEMFGGGAASQKSERLSAAQLRTVTAEQIDAAVEQLLAGGDAPNFADSTDYDLVAPDGTRLAPKKVFGLALEQALGIGVKPGHFSAGHGHPVFQLLEQAGYPIVRKGEGLPADLTKTFDDDLALAEGNPRLATHLKRERRPALANAKRRAMREELGHLHCERCDLVSSHLGPHGDAVIEVHHAKTGIAEMKPGHVTRLADLQCLCANCHRIVHREIASAKAGGGAFPRGGTT